MEGFLRRIWQSMDIDRICLIKKGVFLVRFNNLEDQSAVAKKGNPEMDINTESITSLPIWVRFLDLDIKYWELSSLSKLGSILGIPIKIDRYTIEKTKLQYASLLIDIPVDDAFPEFIDFINDQEVVVRLQNMNESQLNATTAECLAIKMRNAGRNLMLGKSGGGNLHNQIKKGKKHN
ncbi:LOW QUALITY PROTEIN: hypothetical protein Cgig2_033791 [Carnegiea gigantea]|uniref:DUF4283 domain-containing protein n=1 Tax=Carnegiea gigantea TaxID=171969 RepID=A0A9Q1GXE7_9CARY|nr:LOW QUALITY PROTEIN: hypothetical protein Cgig2_033791 [Carnegiea gigantea]